jgi:hypothetical protein
MKTKSLMRLCRSALCVAILSCAAFVLTACAEDASPAKNVYTSLLPGKWYDADPAKLQEQVQGLLDKAEVQPLENVQALILPHAGYEYSGATAALGVKLLAGKTFSRVILMGPTHRVPMENVASVPDAAAYATPLGTIPLDTEFIKALKGYPQFTTLPLAQEGEHSVEIELPLLQKALGEFKLVPIIVGYLDIGTARKIAAILKSLIDEKTLVIASSDFTHYGQNYKYVPFKENIPEELNKLDMGAYDRIQAKDVQGLYDYLDKTGSTVCGQYAIDTLLAMLPAASEAHLLQYKQSGEITGDYTNSVSYFSIAFTGTWEKGPVVVPETAPETLSAKDKKSLLRLARWTIESAFMHKRFPEDDELPVDVTPPMKTLGAAFVTLTKQGQLRGCIGDIYPNRPLYKSVMTNAYYAAFKDRRFNPLNTSELPEIHVEVSVLTPPAPLANYEDIVLGKHGVILHRGQNQALFLPQVAPEQGWALEEMLEHLSEKAGLAKDSYRQGCTFEVFEADVFGEDPR